MILKENLLDLNEVIKYNTETTDLISNIKKEMEEKINKIKVERQYDVNTKKEDDLRKIIEESAKQEFKETNNKKLLGGIGIRETKNFIYDSTKAFEWAKKHELCLQLDKKAFESLIKTQVLDFVKSDTEIKVTFPAEIKLEG